MAEVAADRRKPAHQLKRSKSVRASLRFIGTKFLANHKPNPGNNNVERMQKAPSLSSLHDYKKSYIHPTENHQFSIVPEFYVKEPVETILKTPVVKLEQKSRFRKNEKIRISTPPTVIAPKAAQVLQIPIKENHDQCLNDVFVNGNGYVDGRRQFGEFDFDYRNNRFQRTSLRLSMMTVKKRSHSAYADFPSYSAAAEMGQS
ncbi:hypothetical protein NQ317_005599 [Molorchus minor]|uniref:Uncharacterized protein n=1 Tax=Molorchus minor TaxID=1323400 RepID=A0ABQ9K7M6_9CUCU|nr:hypothetical protein NQ317_005599 [Molorchus minor]